MAEAKRKKRTFKASGDFYVYILRCKDNTYYTGHTNNLERRLRQHNTGKGGARYTKWKGASELVWKKKYKLFKDAFLIEKRIKKLTRSQKDELVAGRSLFRILKEAGPS